MWQKFLTWTFLIEASIILIVWVLVFLIVKKYWIGPKYTLKSDYLRVPTNNALIVLGLLVPILTGLAAYLYTNAPEASYSSLLASILVMFIVLIVAVWETHSLIQVGRNDDVIEIDIPAHRSLMVGLGLIFALLILGLIYFAIFFLVELSPAKIKVSTGGDSNSTFVLTKRRVQINQTRDQILQEWGKPDKANSSNTEFEYTSDQSTVRLQFDEGGKLQSVSETRITK